MKPRNSWKNPGKDSNSTTMASWLDTAGSTWNFWLSKTTSKRPKKNTIIRFQHEKRRQKHWTNFINLYCIFFKMYVSILVFSPQFVCCGGWTFCWSPRIVVFQQLPREKKPTDDTCRHESERSKSSLRIFDSHLLFVWIRFFHVFVFSFFFVKSPILAQILATL